MLTCTPSLWGVSKSKPTPSLPLLTIFFTPLHLQNPPSSSASVTAPRLRLLVVTFSARRHCARPLALPFASPALLVVHSLASARPLLEVLELNYVHDRRDDEDVYRWGKPFPFHHPSATDHTAIDQFLNCQNPSRQSTDTKEGFWREKVNLDQIQTLEELVKFEDELKSLKNTAMARLQEIESNNRSYEASTTSSSSCLLNCCGAIDEGLVMEDEEINALLGFYDPVSRVLRSRYASSSMKNLYIHQ
ncbi:hypothetical protein Syun_028872 [Stephania yunnanensis]|uniref:Uncharacterized protein n=1 Tax=Stephania yunnanensis TaxID=152371 RepID=A0AAP0E7K5_9MAGN